MTNIYTCERCGISVQSEESYDDFDSLGVATKRGDRYIVHLLCPACRHQLHDWYFIRPEQEETYGI